MARKILAPVLIGLGAFLLVAGIIGSTWAPDVVKRTPLDTDSTTRLAGQAQKLNPSTGEVEDLKVRATSFTRADSKRSDDDVIVFDSVTCVVVDVPDTPDCGAEGTGDDADPNVITITTAAIAADRRTGEALNDMKYLPADATIHEGIVNKFPFDVEKKTYPYWDALLYSTVDAEFDGTEKVEGLETYRFVVSIDEQPATVVSGTKGTYSLDKTMWVDPVTGAIVKQQQHDVRKLESGDLILDMELAFTDAQVKADVDNAKSNGTKIALITTVIPWVGYILGPLLLLIGGFLLFRRRSES